MTIYRRHLACNAMAPGFSHLSHRHTTIAITNAIIVAITIAIIIVITIHHRQYHLENQHHSHNHENRHNNHNFHHHHLQLAVNPSTKGQYQQYIIFNIDPISTKFGSSLFLVVWWWWWYGGIECKEHSFSSPSVSAPSAQRYG